MSTYFEVTDPENTNFTLTVTLPLKTWREVSKCLQTDRGVVAWPLRRCINDVVDQATTRFWPSVQDDK